MSANGLYVYIRIYVCMRCARFARAAESDVATARRKRLSQHRCTNNGQNIGHKQASHVEVFSLWCKNYYIYYVLVMLVIGKYAVLLHYYLLAILYTGKPALSHCSPACTLQLWCT